MPKTWSVIRPESKTEQNIALVLISHMLLDERKCDPTLLSPARATPSMPVVA